MGGPLGLPLFVFGLVSLTARERTLPLVLLAETRGSLTRCEAPVRMVGPDPVVVERELLAGMLDCPTCKGVLRPWGFAVPRMLRGRAGGVRLRPRRSICAGCGGTHVLLPVACLLRRVDLAVVIGTALLAKQRGAGHRRIAAELGLPATTVRGWLRRFAARAELIRAHFTMLALALDASLPGIEPRGSPTADALEAVGVAARAATRRFGSAPVWQFAAGATGGRLLGNTSSPFPAVW